MTSQKIFPFDIDFCYGICFDMFILNIWTKDNETRCKPIQLNFELKNLNEENFPMFII